MNRAQLIGRALATAPARWLLAGLERVAPWPRDRFVALTYHRVDDVLDDGRTPGLVSASPAAFAGHVEILASRFSVVDLGTVLGAARGDAELPERAVLLTFDDAVDDFDRNVWPVLHAAGLPATLFVPTAFAGDRSGTFWWDALHAAMTSTARRHPVPSPIGALPLATARDRADAFRRMRAHLKTIPFREVAPIVEQLCAECEVTPPPAAVLDWDALRRLGSAGVACCPHTRTHPHLDLVPGDVARQEVEGSIADLRGHLGSCPPVFAYPSGRHDDVVVDIVRDAGIELAFTTQRGANRLGATDPLRLRRINVSRRTGLEAALAQAHPWADGALRSRERAS